MARRYDRRINKIIADDIELRSTENNLFLTCSHQALARIFVSLMLQRAQLVMMESKDEVDTAFEEALDYIFSNFK